MEQSAHRGVGCRCWFGSPHILFLLRNLRTTTIRAAIMTTAAIPVQFGTNSMDQRRSLCVWTFVFICRTSRISDPAPMRPGMKPRRHRGVRCIRLVGPSPAFSHRRSRCGRWSRFQRARAASLVSSKRDLSVGDSTWSSQNATLALP